MHDRYMSEQDMLSLASKFSPYRYVSWIDISFPSAIPVANTATLFLWQITIHVVHVAHWRRGRQRHAKVVVDSGSFNTHLCWIQSRLEKIWIVCSFTNDGFSMSWVAILVSCTWCMVRNAICINGTPLWFF